VAVPDVIPIVDTFNSSAENLENFENSTQSVRDWSGEALQQQAWGWLASNLTAIMNQLKGNVRNDSAKRAQFEQIQDNLIVNGWKKQTVGCFVEWFLFDGTTVSAAKTNKAIRSATAAAEVFMGAEQDDETADLGGGRGRPWRGGRARRRRSVRTSTG
jgi:hypothetical protein